MPPLEKDIPDSIGLTSDGLQYYWRNRPIMWPSYAEFGQGGLKCLIMTHPPALSSTIPTPYLLWAFAS